MGKQDNATRANCARGGVPRTGGMRNSGGIKAMPYGQSSKVMDEAKGKTTGKVGMEGIGVDGVPVRSGLDRPGRKMGGKAKPNAKNDHDGDED